MRCRKKLEQWEMELKRQTQPALAVIIGCFWEHAVQELQRDLQEKLAIYKVQVAFFSLLMYGALTQSIIVHGFHLFKILPERPTTF